VKSFLVRFMTASTFLCSVANYGLAWAFTIEGDFDRAAVYTVVAFVGYFASLTWAWPQ
jgi:type IV secretory pathway TrbL component